MVFPFGRFWQNPGEDLYERSWWLFGRGLFAAALMMVAVVVVYLLDKTWAALACVLPGSLAALLFGGGALIGLVAWRRADPRSGSFLLPVLLNGGGFLLLAALVFAVARTRL